MEERQEVAIENQKLTIMFCQTQFLIEMKIIVCHRRGGASCVLPLKACG